MHVDSQHWYINTRRNYIFLNHLLALTTFSNIFFYFNQALLALHTVLAVLLPPLLAPYVPPPHRIIRSCGFVVRLYLERWQEREERHQQRFQQSSDRRLTLETRLKLQPCTPNRYTPRALHSDVLYAEEFTDLLVNLGCYHNTVLAGGPSEQTPIIELRLDLLIHELNAPHFTLPIPFLLPFLTRAPACKNSNFRLLYLKISADDDPNFSWKWSASGYVFLIFAGAKLK